jgi:hypothetical protein
MSRHNFTANKICSLDETGNTTFYVPPNIICAKRIKKVGSVTSCEKWKKVTKIFAVNALGNHVPPVLIGLFVDSVKHVITREMSCKETPFLLTLDYHESHL